jgi:hypothetical protein
MKSLLFFLLFMFSISALGQTPSTIYEMGKPLTSCECNFENLFANWGPRFITNHDDIKPVSYSFVETLQDTGRVALYAEKLSDPELVSARSEGKSHGYGDEKTPGKMTHEFRIFPNKITIPAGKEKEAQLEFQRMKKLFMGHIHVGDKVFEIKIKYAGTEYTALAFCRPGENHVILDTWKFMETRDLYFGLHVWNTCPGEILPCPGTD